MGAKIVGNGGRVILLSDGQANVGRYTLADELAKNSAHSFQHYGVTTSTIGVGQDYDEALMAGMARFGGGSHYFAHTVDAIMNAFSQEQFNIGAVAIERLSIRVGGRDPSVVHLWAGETKKVVFQVSDLQEVTVRFTDRSTGERKTYPANCPREFGHSEDVTLEAILERVAELESQAVQVRDPRTAAQMAESLRLVHLELLNHSLSDTPLARAVLERLRESRERLLQLERHYTEEEGTIMRKRSMQASHNLRERARAFSSYDIDAGVTGDLMQSAVSDASYTLQETDALLVALASTEDWEKWQAAPISKRNGRLRLLMANPKDGFVIREIETKLGMRVSPIMRNATPEELLALRR
jgi:hypothetical protein